MAEQSNSTNQVILDTDAEEAQQLSGINDWVSDNLDGNVTNITRLERWRPQWKVEYTANGKSGVVLARGARPGGGGEHSIRMEMRVMEVLEANGIKVPHIYGWMDSPKAFVMEWIDCEDRAPGMVHTAMENPDVMTDDRWQAMLTYMSHLADMHKLPVGAFTDIEGLPNPQSAHEIALSATERMYGYGTLQGNIDPPLEFIQSWLRRNVPEHRTKASFIAGDAGQFMSDGSEILALLDFEIASIGDTHWDLACFRGRHPLENMGDIPALYRRYGEITGEAVDLPVVCYHTVAFLQLAGIAAKSFGDPKSHGGNWIEGILEYSSITRRAMEAIAELKGMTLDYDLHLPEPVTKYWEDYGLNKLLVDIDRLPTSTSFETWERELLGAIPKFLLNYSRYRDWFEAEAVADINQLTGESNNNLEDAETAVMRVIAQGDESHDEALVRIMHKRILRLSMIIAGTDPDDVNPLFYKLDRILD